MDNEIEKPLSDTDSSEVSEVPTNENTPLTEVSSDNTEEVTDLTEEAVQVNDEFNALKLPCSVIMNYEMMKSHPHYLARGTFTTWHDDNKDKDIMGVNAIPFFKNNPSQIFRGGPVYGADNEDILEELGYDEAKIAELYANETIKK